MTKHKKLKDKNNLTVYVFQKNEDIDINKFGNKKYSHYIVGKSHSIPSESGWLHWISRQTIWDQFIKYDDYKEEMLWTIKGYSEDTNGDYYVDPETQVWSAHPESKKHKDHPVNNTKKIKAKRAVGAVGDFIGGIWYLIGVLIFAYLLIKMMTGL